MTNTNRDFEKGEKIHCKSWQDLRTTALILSSKGYGVAVIGFGETGASSSSSPSEDFA